MKMHRRTFVALTASMVAVALSSTPAATTRIEKSIMVTVLDGDDVPVKGLTASDMFVFEDRVRREVLSVEPATEPMFVSVLIDNAKAPMGAGDPVRDMRTSLGAFVTTLLTAAPTAQISLTTVGGAGVMLKNFSDSPADLTKSLGRLVPDLRSSSVVLEAMIDASRELAKKPGPRRVIVTVDLASKEASQVVPTKVIEAVQKAGVAVWAVSVQGPQGVTSPTRDTAINYLTENTGGVRTTALMPSALERMLTTLADSLTTQYVVTYTRPDGPAPKAIAVSAKKGKKFLMAPWTQ